MSRNSVPLLTLEPRTAESAKLVVLVVSIFVVMLLVFPPSVIQAGPGRIWNSEGEPDVGHQMSLESVGQNGGYAWGVVPGVAAFRQDRSEGDPELQTLGAKPILRISAHNETVGDPTTECANGGTGCKADENSKWLHSYLVGLVLGGLIGPLLAPFTFDTLDRAFDRLCDWLRNKGYLT